jgi:hypothetical protein
VADGDTFTISGGVGGSGGVTKITGSLLLLGLGLQTCRTLPP